MTIEVRPGPRAKVAGSRRLPSSIPYGNEISLGRLVVGRDEHRPCVEHLPQAFTDELDDRVVLELAPEGEADLVDEGQLGVALTGLLDGPRAAECRSDVLADERQQVPVVLRVEVLGVVGLDDDHAEGLALRR